MPRVLLTCLSVCLSVRLSLEYFNSASACARRRRRPSRSRRVGNQTMNASTKIVHHVSTRRPSLYRPTHTLEMRRVDEMPQYDTTIDARYRPNPTAGPVSP